MINDELAFASVIDRTSYEICGGDEAVSWLHFRCICSTRFSNLRFMLHWVR